MIHHSHMTYAIKDSRIWLNKHRVVHTGEKTYVCDTCHKGFPRKHYLTTDKY